MKRMWDYNCKVSFDEVIYKFVIKMFKIWSVKKIVMDIVWVIKLRHVIACIKVFSILSSPFHTINV